MTMETLTGWGRSTFSRARVVRPDSVEQVAQTVAQAPAVLGRGLGRAYGDAAQCAGGLVISTDRLQDCSEPAGVMDVAAGVSIHDLLLRSVPAGYFVPVTPGTRYVSMGGALASDIQGKNHHADGALSAHTESMDLVLADGTRVTVTPDNDPDLFWATAGGLGSSQEFRVGAERNVQPGHAVAGVGLTGAGRALHNQVAAVEVCDRVNGFGKEVLGAADDRSM